MALLKVLVLFAVLVSVLVHAQASSKDDPEFAWPEKADGESDITKDQFGTYGETRYLNDKWFLYTSKDESKPIGNTGWADRKDGSAMKFFQTIIDDKKYWVSISKDELIVVSEDGSDFKTFGGSNYPKRGDENSFVFGQYAFIDKDNIYDLKAAMVSGVKKLDPMKKNDKVTGLSDTRKRSIPTDCFGKKDAYCAQYLEGTTSPAGTEGIGKGEDGQQVVLFFGENKMYAKCGTGVGGFNKRCHYYIDGGEGGTYFVPKDLLPEDALNKTGEIRTMLFPLIKPGDKFLTDVLNPPSKASDLKPSHKLAPWIIALIAVGCAVLVLAIVGGVVAFFMIRRCQEKRAAKDEIAKGAASQMGTAPSEPQRKDEFDALVVMQPDGTEHKV